MKTNDSQPLSVLQYPITQSISPEFIISKQQVARRLLDYGAEILKLEGSYTDHKAADKFVRSNSNAFLFAVIFDQGIPYEKAWKAPYLLKHRLGHFDMRRLARMPISRLRRAVKGNRPGEALHRYVNKLPVWLKAAASKLVKEYDGDASTIWNECLTAGEVIERLDEFPGISKKKAHMATRLLHEEDGPYLRWRDINVAVDVHVRRVWKRAGLSKDLSVEGIMKAAMALKPDYPGALDYPTWMVGMEWCHPRRPDCMGTNQEENRACPLNTVCPKVSVPRAARD